MATRGSGFEMSVFNHTEFLGGFKNLENTKRINEDLFIKIREEAYRSDIVQRATDFTISRVLSKGYTIEFAEPGQKFKMSDNYVNTVLNRLWSPELEKGIRISNNNGMYVVQYIAIEEIDSIETVYRPFVLDPDDYIIRFRKNKDGRREYGAFHRSQNLMDKPIKQSRVMVIWDCESDGSIVSPVQKALEQIIQLREYWERNTVVDHKNAFPLHNYYIDNSQQKIIPNRMPPNAVTPFEDNYEIDARNHDTAQLGAMHAADSTTRFMKKLLDQQITADETEQTYGHGERYDPLNRRYMYVAKENPILPLNVVPSGMRLETGGPKPVFNPHFKEVVSDLVHRITGDLGVPSEFVYDTGRKFAADFELTQAIINATTEFWQSKLEQHIVTFYLDLYYRDIVNHVDRVFNTADQILNLSKTSNPDAKVKGSLSSTDKQMLQRNITITVQFASNPMLKAEDVQWLKEQRVISNETFQALALDIYRLPHSLHMTDEEAMEEDRVEAKRQKMMQDIILPPEQQQQQPGQRPKAAGATPKATSATPKAAKSADRSKKRKNPD